MTLKIKMFFLHFRSVFAQVIVVIMDSHIGLSGGASFSIFCLTYSVNFYSMFCSCDLINRLWTDLTKNK